MLKTFLAKLWKVNQVSSQNLENKRRQKFRKFLLSTGSGSIYTWHIQDQNPLLRDRFRIRIHFYVTDSGSGSIFTWHIQNPDSFLSDRFRIRIHFYVTDSVSGSIFTRQIQNPDPFLRDRFRIRIRYKYKSLFFFRKCGCMLKKSFQEYPRIGSNNKFSHRKPG